MNLNHEVIESPIGPLTLVARDGQLAEIHFAGRAPAADRLGPRSRRGLAPAIRQLGEYFAGKRRSFELDLAPQGTAFQLAVWRALRAIPYGETRSYGELAAAIGRRGAARAVGAANGHNPIPIIVPCHRVIGADGTLVGFGGGLECKRQLLALEGIRSR